MKPQKKVVAKAPTNGKKPVAKKAESSDEDSDEPVAKKPVAKVAAKPVAKKAESSDEEDSDDEPVAKKPAAKVAAKPVAKKAESSDEESDDEVQQVKNPSHTLNQLRQQVTAKNYSAKIYPGILMKTYLLHSLENMDQLSMLKFYTTK